MILEHRQTVDTTVREVAGSNPGRTRNKGLKITGKIMLAACLTSCLSLDDRVIGIVMLSRWPCLLHLSVVFLVGDVKDPIALYALVPGVCGLLCLSYGGTCVTFHVNYKMH